MSRALPSTSTGTSHGAAILLARVYAEANLRFPRRGAVGRVAVEARVVRVDPAHGAAGVFCDVPVVATLSDPVLGASLHDRSLVVAGPSDPVDGILRASPDGTVLIWTPRQPLAAHAVHTITVRGLRTLDGRPFHPHESSFVTSALALEDFQLVIDESGPRGGLHETAAPPATHPLDPPDVNLPSSVARAGSR